MSELDTVPAVTPDILPWGQDFFESLLASAATVEGGDLLSGDDAKAPMVGVPHVIYKVTYRDGVKTPDGKIRNYISFDVVVANRRVLTERHAFLPKDFAFQPGQRLVYNDGSTGLARQMTSYLHDRGVITVAKDIVEAGGGMGQSTYDLPREEWLNPSNVRDVVHGLDDYEFDLQKLGKPLYLPRGLRFSEYKADATNQDAKTYYFG